MQTRAEAWCGLVAVSLMMACAAPPSTRRAPAIAGVVADLESGDLSRRMNGMIAARHFGSEGEPAVQPLVRLLFEDTPQDVEDDTYRQLAFRALAAIGTESAIAGLISELSGKLGPQVSDSLVAIARGNAKAQSLLISGLERADSRDTIEAVLIEIGPPAYLALAHAALDPARQDRRDLVELLERFDTPSPDAIPLVLSLLQDSEWRIRLAALRALVRFEDRAAPALPQLLKSSEDKDEMLREEAITAGAKIGRGHPDVFELLIRLLEDEEVWIRRVAIRNLGSWGQLAKAAEPALARALARDPVLSDDIEGARFNIAWDH